MAFCTKCGHKLKENQKFCTGCGKVVGTSTNNAPIQDRKVEEKKLQSPLSKVNETIKPVSQSNIGSSAASTAAVSITTERPAVQPQEYYIPVQKSSSAFKKPLVAAILLTICSLGLLTGVFFKQIKVSYYLIRYNIEKDTIKRFEYAGQAVSNLNTISTYNAFKASSEELIKQAPDMVEAKLDQLESSIKPEDYKDLKTSLYNEKVTASVASEKYDEALSNLVKFQENGGCIKENPKYETIMLNVIAKTTETKVYDNRTNLYSETNIMFENLDEDPFDEIVEIKDLAPDEYFQKQYDINLYKLKNDKYEKVQTMHNDYTTNTYGNIYTYTEGKKGLFIMRSASSYSSGATVYIVRDNKFVDLGGVASNDPCEVQDFDKDGIYEVVTAELDDPYGQYSHADSPRKVRYYKFSDGSEPEIVKEERLTSDNLTPSSDTSTDVTPQPSTDYIFPDSDKRYLLESEISALSKEQLSYARNEIYARHGYVFNTDKYAQYFSSKSWYIPDPSFAAEDTNLNQYEIENYTLIQNYEK